MNEKDLRALIAEQASLLMTEQEAEEVPGGDEPDAPSADSVDAQIDELLLQYEKLSLPTEEEIVQEIVNKRSLRFILEQEEVNVDVNVEEEGEGEEDAEEAAEEEEAEFETALMDKFQLAVPEEEVEKLVASDLPAPPAVGAGPGGGAGG